MLRYLESPPLWQTRFFTFRSCNRVSPVARLQLERKEDSLEKSHLVFTKITTYNKFTNLFDCTIENRTFVRISTRARSSFASPEEAETSLDG